MLRDVDGPCLGCRSKSNRVQDGRGSSVQVDGSVAKIRGNDGSSPLDDGIVVDDASTDQNRVVCASTARGIGAHGSRCARSALVLSVDLGRPQSNVVDDGHAT